MYVSNHFVYRTITFGANKTKWLYLNTWTTHIFRFGVILKPWFGHFVCKNISCLELIVISKSSKRQYPTHLKKCLKTKSFGWMETCSWSEITSLASQFLNFSSSNRRICLIFSNLNNNTLDTIWIKFQWNLNDFVYF